MQAVSVTIQLHYASFPQLQPVPAGCRPSHEPCHEWTWWLEGRSLEAVQLREEGSGRRWIAQEERRVVYFLFQSTI